MNKKYYKNNKEFKNINNQLIIDNDIDLVNEIWLKAEESYSALSLKYIEPNADNKDLLIHLKKIISHIALYKVLKEQFGMEKALELMEEQSKINAYNQRELIVKFTNIFPKTFLKIFYKATQTSFGKSAGFEYNYNEKSSKKIKFNTVKCPYCTYCIQNDCYELVHIFCDNDIYHYADLPKISFERTQTLGRDGECCDFELSLRNI